MKMLDKKPIKKRLTTTDRSEEKHEGSTNV
jgi:hypothetical protein